MTSLRYIRRWCVVKGHQSWNFETEAQADAWADQVSDGEQVDIHEWVDDPSIPDRGGRWVWRGTTLVTVIKGAV